MLSPCSRSAMPLIRFRSHTLVFIALEIHPLEYTGEDWWHRRHQRQSFQLFSTSRFSA